ncbi:hypothetical protein GF362_05385 [Candidatus Dojkabacteria bacterium]|nr:hypothetical protein [Candidatus Dojkabacteria bacterium]
MDKTYIKKLLKIFIISFWFLLISIKYSNAATFELVPSTAIFTDCTNTIQLIIDSTEEDVNAADIEIFFDPKRVKIQDRNYIKPKIQIQEGDAFETYWGNKTNNETGQILLAAGSLPDPSITLSSRVVFAEITFSYRGPEGHSTTFEIRFNGIGNTIDSNIADTTTGNDLLTSVQNGVYSFVTGNKCFEDHPQLTPYPFDNEYTSSTVSPESTTTPTTTEINCPECLPSISSTPPSATEYIQTQEQITTKWYEKLKNRMLESTQTSVISILCCCLTIQIPLLLIVIKRRNKQKERKINYHLASEIK